MQRHWKITSFSYLCQGCVDAKVSTVALRTRRQINHSLCQGNACFGPTYLHYCVEGGIGKQKGIGIRQSYILAGTDDDSSGDKLSTKEQYLRGNIIKCEFVDNSLSIEAEEDWVTADFRHPLESHYEGMTIYYMVESYCDETYATNDAEGKYFPTRVSVDFHLKEPVLCGYERFNTHFKKYVYLYDEKNKTS